MTKNHKLDIKLKLASKLVSGLADRFISDRLAILIYHRVRNDKDPLTPYDMSVEQFDWEMALLKRYFNVLPLDQALELLSRGQLPSRAVCITFDDGYTDQSDIALPVLQKYGHQAAFFVPTGYLECGCMWNDLVIETIRHFKEEKIDLSRAKLGVYSTDSVDNKRKTIVQLLAAIKHFHPEKRNETLSLMRDIIGFDVAKNLMMGKEKIKLLVDAGMEIGNHTKMHPILTSLPDQEAFSEIVESKAVLENITNKRVRYFAYPNGKPYEDYMPEHVEICRQGGFEAALSTAKGVAVPGSDIYQLPRFTPWDDNSLKFMLRLIGNYTETEPLVV